MSVKAVLAVAVDDAVAVPVQGFGTDGGYQGIPARREDQGDLVPPANVGQRAFPGVVHRPLTRVLPLENHRVYGRVQGPGLPRPGCRSARPSGA
ncbi:MAG: hypothetical protein MZV64_09635 [Ignavibacteriales bacterium]|nr:hypothetical protein [Ignavibacteriales bacterium]